MKVASVKQLLTCTKFYLFSFHKKLRSKTMILPPKMADFKAWSHSVIKANWDQMFSEHKKA